MTSARRGGVLAAISAVAAADPIRCAEDLSDLQPESRTSESSARNVASRPTSNGQSGSREIIARLRSGMGTSGFGFGLGLTRNSTGVSPPDRAGKSVASPLASHRSATVKAHKNLRFKPLSVLQPTPRLRLGRPTSDLRPPWLAVASCVGG